MATGDDALAAGMPIMSGSELANTLDTEINLTRDFIAQRTATVTPVAKGGTGATNATAARTALGITAVNIPTNGSNVQNDIDGLAVTKLSLTTSQYNNDFSFRDSNIAAALSGANNAFARADEKVAKTGDTMSGNLFLPNSSAATSSFTVCYINGDGRVSRGSSSRRYKKNIREAGGLGNLFAAPLREYRMRVDGNMPDDGEYHVGYIAEELVDTDMERFVVYVDDQVESIDFIALLLAQTAQLNQRLVALEARTG